MDGLAGLAVQRLIDMTELRETLLINIKELSELTALSEGHLYHMVSQHRIPCVKLSQALPEILASCNSRMAGQPERASSD